MGVYYETGAWVVEREPLAMSVVFDVDAGQERGSRGGMRLHMCDGDFVVAEAFDRVGRREVLVVYDARLRGWLEAVRAACARARVVPPSEHEVETATRLVRR